MLHPNMRVSYDRSSFKNLGVNTVGLGRELDVCSLAKTLLKTSGKEYICLQLAIISWDIGISYALILANPSVFLGALTINYSRPFTSVN